MTVKVSPKYQVVIPESARKSLGLRPGSRVDVVVKGKVAYLVPVSEMEDLQKDLAGKMSSKGGREKRDRIA